MIKDIVIFLMGAALIVSCLFLTLSDEAVSAAAGLVWGGVLYASPRFSNNIRLFWRRFWRINIKMSHFWE